MIFSLGSGLRVPASRVKYNGKPVSYSWGNLNALHRWIESKNQEQVAVALDMEGAQKYPLIWLVEGWEGSKHYSGQKFSKVTFYISVNSTVTDLNESRTPNFDVLYKVTNDFITELKKSLTVHDDTVRYTERANFSVSPGRTSANDVGGSVASDIWDSLIVSLNLSINTNCLKTLIGSS